jgi:tetratricopeptide (TPR) repeat protein
VVRRRVIFSGSLLAPSVHAGDLVYRLCRFRSKRRGGASRNTLPAERREREARKTERTVMRFTHDIRRTCPLRVLWLLLIPVFASGAGTTEPYVEGLRLMGEGRYVQAVAVFQTLLPDGRDAGRACIQMVEAWKRANDPAAASSFFQEFISHRPDNPYGHHGLGLVLREQGNDRKALEQLRAAVQLAPGYAPAARDLTELLHRNRPPEAAALAPCEFGLLPNYPNPFNPSTSVTFSMPASSGVRLTVFDVRGRKVRTLIDGRREAGVHRVTLDGAGLAGGVYVLKLESEFGAATRKIVLIQ